MADPIEVKTESTQVETPVESKVFTQQEVDALVAKRLSRYEKTAEEKIKQAVSEAQKLAQMTAEERSSHEREELEKTLKAREAEITKRELRALALEMLGEKGLPRDLAEVLPYSDADGTKQALESVERVFRKAVQAGVEERLKGTTPKINTPVATGDSITDEIRKSIYGK